MVRGGRAEAPASRSDISFRLDQKTGNFKAVTVVVAASRLAAGSQWSPSTEEKQKNQLAQTEFRFINNNYNNNKGGQLRPVVLRMHISVALQQKTANFKAAFVSRPMQWSHLTEEKQKS